MKPFETKEEVLSAGLKNKQKVEFVCSICGKIETRKVESLKKSDCFRCKSCIAKYARSQVDTSKIDYKEVVKKAAETNQIRYGCHPSKLQSVKDKVASTNLVRYGCHPSKLQSVKDKVAKTNLERYGCKAVFQSEEVRQTFRDNCQKKYGNGIINPFQAEEVKEKTKQTLLAKYGVDNPQKSPVIKQKTEQTNLQRFGATCNWANHDNRLKCYQRYFFNGIKFDSSLELIYFLYLSENNFHFEYQPDIYFTYSYKGKEHRYFPDFKVGNIYQEIKGNQFIKEDGTWQNVYDHSLDALYEAKHQCLLENKVVILLADSEVLKKAKTYVDTKYGKNYVSQFRLTKNKNDVKLIKE